eukprot:CAMPEP_0115016524 /NCGR_PEP_ID=MMETSP0216-20121206/27497_1 /TAXON_ID=223996 /ORGANISM="Protocruzia adherens, Strain Boccale" /LENGTH=196 /DNA_ID=CAMNT_0002387015 /DNA_START=301 /DNA_END=888 /DNA_ORIENTATION=-
MQGSEGLIDLRVIPGMELLTAEELEAKRLNLIRSFSLENPIEGNYRHSPQQGNTTTSLMVRDVSNAVGHNGQILLPNSQNCGLQSATQKQVTRVTLSPAEFSHQRRKGNGNPRERHLKITHIPALHSSVHSGSGSQAISVDEKRPYTNFAAFPLKKLKSGGGGVYTNRSDRSLLNQPSKVCLEAICNEFVNIHKFA